MVRFWPILPVTLFALVAPIDAGEPPSFLNEVVPLLTKLGCNQGACHGKGAGQNGFRLSLRGYDPERDLASLTREFSGRRIDPTAPEASLLLQKPLGAVKHEGGRLINRGSREYQTLFNWIAGGTPGPKLDDPKLTRLQVRPGSSLLKVGDKLPLAVEAEFSDGSHRDVTWLTRFDSNDAAVIEVSAAGVVRALRNGETAVRASFQTEVAIAIFTIPFERQIASERFAGPLNAIDEYVFRKLAALRLEPSDRCDDATFLRRAFLDTIGVLPTPEELREFLADGRTDKRSRVIDALLARPEFVDFWTLFLCDLLQNRKERDHDVRGTKGVRTFHEWVRRQVAANRPWDEIARGVLTATGSSRESPAVGYFVVTVGENREAHRSEVVASAAQAFLGTRIGCAQCHNHPLERYTQDDYYHFAAYFSRIRLERKESKDGPTVLRISGPDPNQNKNPVGVPQPRTGKFMAPQPLDHSPLPVSPQEDPRAKLAAWVTDPRNEAFAGAMVNRLWRHFLGVGLVEPVDDLRATNPPTNPELWQYLCREFVAHRFDLKHVMRLILNSRTYQTESATRAANATDMRYFSHFYPRRMTAEVLADAIASATGVPYQYPGYPLGVRAVQLPDPGVKSTFLEVFGRPARVTACACERADDIAIPHLLHLLNGDEVLQKIRSGDGRLASQTKAGKSEPEIIDEIFLATIGRRPKESELAAVRRWDVDPRGRPALLEDLFWSLLNTKEFAFNH